MLWTTGLSEARLARYFQDFDDEIGVTLSRLRRFGRERQWPYIRHWFRRMFEDPANETPQSEGRFRFVWGGPYDALDELQGEFSGIPFERLADFAERLERQGGVIEWAPGPAHPDHLRAAEDHARDDGDQREGERPSLEDLLARLQAGAQTHFGDVIERRERAETLRRLEALDAKLERLIDGAAGAAGLGHNRPPEPLSEETDAADRARLSEARSQAAGIRDELRKDRPDALVVASKTAWLKKLLLRLGGGVAAGLVTGAANKVGQAWCDQHPELVRLAVEYIDQSVAWLHHVVTAII